MINVQIALVFYAINLVLAFFSRKVFLDNLGTEILGLNTTAVSLLGFLNLAELGIGSAVAFSLYRPLYEKDFVAINEIVSIQGWLYRRVAYVVLGCSGILILFFPLIFEKSHVPIGYTYAVFIVLLVSSLLGYFFNYKQIVLTADQKEYKLTINVQGFRILKVLLQIVAVVNLENGYVYWLLLELLMAILTAITIEMTLKKEYPWLKSTPALGHLLKNQYPLIILKTKQLFFHKIGVFALQQTSPLVIYTYASLTLVAIYGNYLMITSGITMLLTAMFNSISAGIGSLVAEGDKIKIWKVFRELFLFRFFISFVCCLMFYLFTTSFVSLWIGEEYILDSTSFILLTIILYINLMRPVIDAFISAYGLFSDIWATIVEAFLNIGLSFFLGHFWGLSGILLGMLISLCIIIIWKPYFLFSKGLKIPLSKYWLYYLKMLLLGGGAFFISILFINSSVWMALEITNWTSLIIAMSAIFLLACLSLLLLMLCFTSDLKAFLIRFLHR